MINPPPVPRWREDPRARATWGDVLLARAARILFLDESGCLYETCSRFVLFGGPLRPSACLFRPSSDELGIAWDFMGRNGNLRLAAQNVVHRHARQQHLEPDSHGNESLYSAPAERRRYIFCRAGEKAAEKKMRQALSHADRIRAISATTCESAQRFRPKICWNQQNRRRITRNRWANPMADRMRAISRPRIPMARPIGSHRGAPHAVPLSPAGASGAGPARARRDGRSRHRGSHAAPVTARDLRPEPRPA